MVKKPFKFPKNQSHAQHVVGYVSKETRVSPLKLENTLIKRWQVERKGLMANEYRVLINSQDFSDVIALDNGYFLVGDISFGTIINRTRYNRGFSYPLY